MEHFMKVSLSRINSTDKVRNKEENGTLIILEIVV